jgi:hypothetical protein
MREIRGLTYPCNPWLSVILEISGVSHSYKQVWRENR